MKDLGQQLFNERGYVFSRVYIQQLIFRSSGDEILMHCKIFFNEQRYAATLCTTFEQFNELLMRSGDREFRLEVSALIGEAMTMEDQKKLQTSFQIDLIKIFGRPLRVRKCHYHTNLVELPLEELVEKPDQAYVFVVSKMSFQRVIR